MSQNRGVVRIDAYTKTRGGAPSNRDRVIRPARGGGYRREVERAEARIRTEEKN